VGGTQNGGLCWKKKRKGGQKGYQIRDGAPRPARDEPEREKNQGGFKDETNSSTKVEREREKKKKKKVAGKKRGFKGKHCQPDLAQ